MDDLVKWLREQIAEDEEAARDAGGCRWQRDGISCVEDADNRSLVVYGEGTPSQEEADHIARHDPAAVLAQCEAHGRILARHEPRLADYGPHEGKLICGCSNGKDEFYATEWPCDDIRDLASAYRHRPGYREEWKP